MYNINLSLDQKSISKPALLIVATTWWSSVAMLASSLQQVGFDVTVLCPKGHVAWHAKSYRCWSMDRTRPLQSLAEAVSEIGPALVIPGDDRSVLFLTRLHANADRRIRNLIERSLGPEVSFNTLVSRVPLLQAAREVGVAVPDGGDVETIAELDRWMEKIPSPWVVKVDGAWGGEGVRIAKTREEARSAFGTLSQGLPLWMALKRKFMNGDPFWMHDRKVKQEPVVSVQSFIRGRPGNCALFCLDGELLGATIVEAETCCNDIGPSTLVRVVERPAVRSGARRLVRKLGLSGFFGLDFMVDEATDEALLIEMNPRITAPCRIRTPAGTDPISAAARAFGCVGFDASSISPRSLFASFPLAWQTNPHDPRLASCHDDIPWHEPGLVEEALKPIWPERGTVAHLPWQFRSLLHFLKSGQRSFDYRLKPFSWWITEGPLQPPSHVDGLRRPSSPDLSALRLEPDRTAVPRPS